MGVEEVWTALLVLLDLLDLSDRSVQPVEGFREDQVLLELLVKMVLPVTPEHQVRMDSTVFLDPRANRDHQVALVDLDLKESLVLEDLMDLLGLLELLDLQEHLDSVDSVDLLDL